MSTGTADETAADAAALLTRAEQVDAACDLEEGLPGSAARLQRATVAVLTDGDLTRCSPRAVWNLLWLAADLTSHVDLYRATELLQAVEQLYHRHFRHALVERGELSEAAEMAFDFFFNRPTGDQPLASLRFDASLAALERVLAIDNRFCRRAALHGIGHLRQHALPAQRVRIDAVLDDVTEPELAAAAARARSADLI
jgi:hypothetical protein